MSSREDRRALEADIALSRSVLAEQGLGLVVARKGRVVASSSEHGVRPLLRVALRRREDIAGAAVADRVVGRASAMLCVYCRAAAVSTPLASEGAVRELRSAGIRVAADVVVPSILNRTGTDVCPFEKMTAGLGSADDVVRTLEAFFAAREGRELRVVER